MKLVKFIEKIFENCLLKSKDFATETDSIPSRLSHECEINWMFHNELLQESRQDHSGI